MGHPMPTTKSPAKPPQKAPIMPLHHTPTLPTIEQDTTSAELWELRNDTPRTMGSDESIDFDNDSLDFMLQIDMTFL